MGLQNEWEKPLFHLNSVVFCPSRAAAMLADETLSVGHCKSVLGLGMKSDAGRAGEPQSSNYPFENSKTS